MDYSGHLIQANKLMRQIYDLCQEQKYMDAMTQCLDAIAEIKMAYNAMNHNVQDKDQLIGMWENK
jgi:predicted DNA-binding protein with PD1-like motif